MKRGTLFNADGQNEEALMLMGRVEAFAAYVRNSKYAIDREVIAAMLNFDLEDKPCQATEE